MRTFQRAERGQSHPSIETKRELSDGQESGFVHARSRGQILRCMNDPESLGAGRLLLQDSPQQMWIDPSALPGRHRRKIPQVVVACGQPKRQAQFPDGRLPGRHPAIRHGCPVEKTKVRTMARLTPRLHFCHGEPVQLRERSVVRSKRCLKYGQSRYVRQRVRGPPRVQVPSH